MSIEANECDVTLDFYGEHDRHRTEAEGKLLSGDGASSTPEVPNPPTSPAPSNARKRRGSDSDHAEAAVDKRPRHSGGGTPSSASSPSSGTVVNGGFPE